MAGLKFPLMSDCYKGAKRAITVQKPRVSLFTGKQVVPGYEINAIMRELKANPSYDVVRGQINAFADSAGIRLNIITPKEHPGKLLIQVADKSMATSREFVDELEQVFKNKKSWNKHLNNAFDMLANAWNSNKKVGVKTVLIDPKEPFAEKVRNAVYDVIEARELAKY